MSLFPSEAWLAEYRSVLNDSIALDTVGADWGVGFDGDVLLVIEDVPLAETTVSQLPDVVLEDLPEQVREGLADVPLSEAPSLFEGRAREPLPPTITSLLRQLEECVVDGNIYAYIGLRAGDCTSVRTLRNPDARSVGTTVRGQFSTWQQILDGRPAVSAVLRGDLAISAGGLQNVQSPTLLQLLGDLAADVETTHLFPEPTTSFSDFVLDNTVRQPVALQQLAYRQLALTSRTLSPF